MQKLDKKIYEKYLSMRTQKRISLTSSKYRKEVELIAMSLFKDTGKEITKLQKYFEDFQKLKLPITLLLSSKLAISYAHLQSITIPTCISIVFSVYNEKNRLHKKKTNSFGENFLRVKIQQLNDTCNLNNLIRWRLIIVDDGSTDGTGHIIKYILENEYPNLLKENKVQVHFMKDALSFRKKLPFMQYVTNLSESGKGSSILYGIDQAIKSYEPRSNEKHILLYTDADLSVHLGLIGTVLYKMVMEGHDAVIGQRRLRESVVVRPKIKSARGKLYIFLLKQILPVLKDDINDPQAPFKALTEGAFKLVLKLIREPGFAFDVELLLLIKLLGFKSDNFGIGFIDSTQASHTNNSLIHYKMLKKVLIMRKRHFPRILANPVYEKFIRDLTIKKWKKLINHIPDFIKRAGPSKINRLIINPEVFEKIIAEA